MLSGIAFSLLTNHWEVLILTLQGGAIPLLAHLLYKILSRGVATLYVLAV